jgi:hypothetical protein
VLLARDHPTPLDASRRSARPLATLPFQGRVAPSKPQDEMR